MSIWLLWPGQSVARVLVRFIHALPGAGTVKLQVDSVGVKKIVGSVAFAQVTPWRSLRSGQFHWSVIAGRDVIAQGNATVRTGSYDLLLLAKSDGASLGLYRARAGEPGTSLLRIIHAAPELGSPEIKLDSRVLASSVSFTRATPYLSVHPGVYRLTATKAGDSVPLISDAALTLKADAAYSAILLGSRGERLRIVTVIDRGAPLTRAATSRGFSGPRGWVVVRPGDSLWTIVKDHLGPDASNEEIESEVVATWALNRERIGTGDPNLIFPGQRILLPR